MADYRRFVSYIYAYRNGKKEKNTGFAKVEARKRILRISIQLEAPGNRDSSLDAYGFIRKGEKIFGIFLGEMQGTAGSLYFLKVETDTDNIKESGYGLNQLSGLWIKGEPGENYITIWDDEPVKRMDLEIELENEKPEEGEMPEKAPAEVEPEEEKLLEPELKQAAKTPVGPELEKKKEDSTEAKLKKTERISTEPELQKTEKISPEPKHIEPAETAEEQSPENLKKPEKQEKMQILISSEKPINGVRAQEAELITGMEMETDSKLSEEPMEEIMSDPTAGESPNDRNQESKTSEDADQEAVQKQILEPGKKDASCEMDGTVAGQASEPGIEPEPMPHEHPALNSVYTERYATLWERLAPAYAHRNPFQDGEAVDAILISPRELQFFCCKNWSAAKNSFIYHGYYNFHHLLFGKTANGSFFLAVPGTYSAQEQRMAASFGFPLFKESREKVPNCRRGYWCRLL